MPFAQRLQTLRGVLGEALIQAKILRQLAGLLRPFDQLGLKARVADRQQPCNHLGVSLPTQVGDAVLGDDDVAQVPGNGAVTVFPDQVGADLPARFTPAAQQQDRARAFKCMALGNEVVLPTYPAEHPAVFQLIGHPGAHQGHGEHRVDKARIPALQALERLLAIQLVDVADGAHGKAFALA
ncbi:hypothetical protein D3C80_910940 [compost metagenome]